MSRLILHFSFFALLLAALAGCGGGSSSGSGNNPGSSSLFTANSAEININEDFGFESRAVIWRGYYRGAVSGNYTEISYTKAVVRGISSLQFHATAHRADGTTLTLFPVNNTTTPAEEIGAGVALFISNISLAYGRDGWIYLTSSLLSPSGPIRYYPPKAQVGLSWDRSGTAEVTDEKGKTTTHSTKITTTVKAVGVLAPRARISDCILLHIHTADGANSDDEWNYVAPGLGVVETTNVDPSLPQTDASGSFMSF